MFDALFSFLSGIIKGLWEALKWPIEKGWAFLVLAVGWAAYCIDKAGDWITSAVDALSNVTLPSGMSVTAPSGISTWLNIANTFFPLNEMFGYVVAYFSLVTALAIYKHVKSWIPTMGNAP